MSGRNIQPENFLYLSYIDLFSLHVPTHLVSSLIWGIKYVFFLKENKV